MKPDLVEKTPTHLHYLTIKAHNNLLFVYYFYELYVVVFLQEKKLLDLPKLLDICAIYAHDNEELTRTLVCRNILLLSLLALSSVLPSPSPLLSVTFHLRTCILCR